MSARPRLLFVSPRFLFPLDEGGKIRTTGVLRAMKPSRFAITLAAPAPPSAGAFAAEIEKVCDRFVSWPQRHHGRLERALHVIGRLPASVATDRSLAGKQVIARELARGIDLLVVDYPSAELLVPEQFHVPSVIFTHNIEAEIFERRASMAAGMMRFVWHHEAAKMRRFEHRALSRFDTVVAVSSRDAKALTERYRLRRIETIDTGVDLEFYAFHPPAAEARTVVFSGAMDSRSNIDGISFMMDEVWPLLTARQPDVCMCVVGRNPPRSLVDQAKQRDLRWRFTGFVDDVRPHIVQGDVAVIPLRVGSGTRLKAFEAMAIGCPVVSTRLGMEGLPVIPGVHYIAADSPAEFAQEIAQLMADKSLRLRIASNARELLEQRFSWSHVGRQFEVICEQTFSLQNRTPPTEYLPA